VFDLSLNVSSRKVLLMFPLFLELDNGRFLMTKYLQHDYRDDIIILVGEKIGDERL